MPNGQALVVADPSAAEVVRAALGHVGYGGVMVSDPYEAILALARRPLAFRAVLLSLPALYPPELRLIEVIKRRYGHVEVIVSDVRGRSAGLAEAARLGADALLEDGRLHRLAPRSGEPATVGRAAPGAYGPAELPPRSAPASSPDAVLSAEELKALLEE